MCGVSGAAVTGVLFEVSRDHKLPKDRTKQQREWKGKECPMPRIKGKQAFSHVDLGKAGMNEKPKMSSEM